MARFYRAVWELERLSIAESTRKKVDQALKVLFYRKIHRVVQHRPSFVYLYDAVQRQRLQMILGINPLQSG